MSILAAARDNLGVSIPSLLAGILISTMVSRFLAKTKRIRYSVKVDRLALAADDPIFGSIAVTWRNSPVRNLYMAWVEVENSSSGDFDDFGLKVYVAPGTFLLNERTGKRGTPYAVLWARNFKDRIHVNAGETPSPQQLDIYNSSREYHVPVFNRGDLLEITYLCTRNDDVVPGIFVSTQLKGAKLSYQNRSNLIFGVPFHLAIVRGLVLAIITIVVCGVYVHNVWTAALINMMVGLSSSALGALAYKVERWTLKLLAG